MKLEEYMWRNKLTIGEMCQLTGLAPSTISMAKTAKKSLRLENAMRIYYATNASVDYWDLVSEELKAGIEHVRANPNPTNRQGREVSMEDENTPLPC